MHGFIFLQVKKYIQQHHDSSDWHLLLQKAEVSQSSYAATEVYPDSDITKLLQAASAHYNTPQNVLLEQIGEFLVPDLLDIYNMYINPTWNALDMIEHTEHTMHRAVRVSSPEATPPILHATRINPKKLIIDYHSRRRMAPLAVGIIRGIASYYKQADKLKISLSEYKEGERVQITVELED